MWIFGAIITIISGTVALQNFAVGDNLMVFEAGTVCLLGALWWLVLYLLFKE